jgi:hypothetical protein
MGFGLVTQPDPVDSTARLVMSGNVAGGMRFQGLVPYGAETDLRASLGSTYLDSFLRSSQGAVDPRFGLGATIPFYSPSGSFMAVTSGAEGALPATPGGSSAAWSTDRLLEARGPVLETLRVYPYAGVPVAVAESSPDGQEPGQPNAAGPHWTQLYSARTADELGAAASQRRAIESPGPADTQDVNRPEAGLGALDLVGLEPGQAGLVEDPCAPTGRRMTGAGLQQAWPTRTWRSSLDALGQDRYEQAMETGSSRLKEGKPREASDAFGLALLYKPDDTAALAGRSHAMFMAGEYTSSALFLARALDACPDYVRLPVDFAVFAGGEAAVQSRIEEVAAYLRKEASPELRLILAYACYRTGDFTSARRTLDAGPAVDGRLGRVLHTLAKALDEAQNPTGR